MNEDTAVRMQILPCPVLQSHSGALTISLLPSVKERISDAPEDTKCPLSISLIMPETHCLKNQWHFQPFQIDV